MQSGFQKTSQFYDQLLNGHTNFQNIDLSEANLEQLIITKTCDFSNASFQNSILKKANLPGMLMASANFDAADLTKALLKNGKFQNSSFCAAILTEADFFDANLSGANFANATLLATNFRGADLCGANFKGANLANADFSGAIYSLTTSFDNNINPRDMGMTPAEDLLTATDNDADLTAMMEQSLEKKSMLTSGGAPTALEAETNNIEESETVFKEIWYRGVRSVIEVKRTDSSPSTRPGMNYRGVKH